MQPKSYNDRRNRHGFLFVILLLIVGVMASYVVYEELWKAFFKEKSKEVVKTIPPPQEEDLDFEKAIHVGITQCIQITLAFGLLKRVLWLPVFQNRISKVRNFFSAFKNKKKARTPLQV